MPNPRVSVVLPVYNGEKTIGKSVESILQQSFRDFELLVCIDGTNDRSEEIVNALGDSRIRIIKNSRNIGLSSTLNRLIFNSCRDSDYIAMAEQDDWFYPDRLQAQVDFLDNHPEYGLVSGIAEFWTGENDPPGLFPGLLVDGGQYPVDYKEFFLLNYRKMIKVVHSCMMFRRSAYDAFGMHYSCQYPTIHTDWDFIMRFSKYAPVYGLNKILVRKNREDERSSITKKLDRTIRFANELIRAYRFEFADIISWKDYRYASITIKMLKVGHMSFIKRWSWLLWLFVQSFGHPVVRERLALEFRRLGSVRSPKRLIAFGKAFTFLAHLFESL